MGHSRLARNGRIGKSPLDNQSEHPDAVVPPWGRQPARRLQKI
jgi:hypothetical protein